MSELRRRAASPQAAKRGRKPVAGAAKEPSGGKQKARVTAHKPPRKPPRGRVGTAEDDEYRRCLQELHARIADGLSRGRLRPATVREYRKASQRVLDRLSPYAILELHRRVKKFAYYESHAALTQGVLGKYPALAQQMRPGTIFRGMCDKDGTLHLDGGGVMFTGMEKRTTSEFHAHEITHALDRGRERRYSGTAKWTEIWEVEVKTSPLFSRVAKQVRAEAFAEAGAFILGGNKPKAELARDLPRALQFFKDHQLL